MMILYKFRIWILLGLRSAYWLDVASPRCTYGMHDDIYRDDNTTDGFAYVACPRYVPALCHTRCQNSHIFIYIHDVDRSHILGCCIAWYYLPPIPVTVRALSNTSLGKWASKNKFRSRDKSRPRHGRMCVPGSDIHDTKPRRSQPWRGCAPRTRGF